LFNNVGEVRDGFPEAVPYDDVANRDEYDPQTIRRAQMIGTPEEIIPRIQRYAEWGVDQYCYHIDGGLPHADKKDSLERFIRDVIPAFTDIRKVGTGQ
jgi:alkanesulfonate monooxygenase SsuD/methylene tetrahydromethanopterin reductase-like flavin-dependent oxidoreductase (luciferase family)